MITVHLIGNKTYNITPSIDRGEISWGDSGDNEVSITLNDRFSDARDLFRSNYQYKCIVLDSGNAIFNGKFNVNSFDNAISSFSAVGDMYKAQELEDYTEFWSVSGTNNFYVLDYLNSAATLSGELITQPITSAPDLYMFDNDDEVLRIGLKKSAAIPNASGIVFAFELPSVCANDFFRIAYAYEYQVPSGFQMFVQTRDENGGSAANSLNVTPTTTTPVYSSVYSAVGLDARTIYIGFRNNTGGTYTSTQEDGFWSFRIFHFRALAPVTSVITATLTTNTAIGPNVIFTPNSMDGIYVGAKLYTNTANEMLHVKDVTTTTFTADARKAHTIGEIATNPRFTAKDVISDIGAKIGSSVVFGSTPDVDISNALYRGVNAFSLLDSFKTTALREDTVVLSVQNDALTFVAVAAMPTYYADANEIQLSKEYTDYISRINIAYTTDAGVDRIVGPTTNTTALAFNSIRTRQIRSQFTISGAAYVDARDYVVNNTRVTIKSDFKVTRLYNAFGGIIEYPQMGSKIVLRNIIPELLGIADYTYQLKSATLDIVTGKKTYVIGEYLDTLPVLVANA